jgi:hypothetical protein
VTKLAFPNGETMCYDWFMGYTISAAMAATTAMVVVFLNIIITASIDCKTFYS